MLYLNCGSVHSVGPVFYEFYSKIIGVRLRGGNGLESRFEDEHLPRGGSDFSFE